MPSENFELFQKECISQAQLIVPALVRNNVDLPIRELVSVQALFYRTADIGDASGYYQALGDVLQKCGIVANDKLIDDWNNSKRLIDKQQPRVEVTIHFLNEQLHIGDIDMEEIRHGRS